MQLSELQLSFLAHFSKSPDGRQFLEILRAELGEVEGKLRTSVGEDVYRQQGHAQRLDKLIADITQAQDRLKRNRSTPAMPIAFRPNA